MSPIVAAEMVRNAGLAVLFAIIGIFLYIAWAFRKMPHFFRYSLSAVFALTHDILIVLGLFSIMGKVFGIELNTMVITAILAVIGYSINNTIVVFDRIRENMLKRTGERFEVTVNNSLLETMGRSLNTSLTTLITLLALALFGGSTLLPFILVFAHRRDCRNVQFHADRPADSGDVGEQGVRGDAAPCPGSTWQGPSPHPDLAPGPCASAPGAIFSLTPDSPEYNLTLGNSRARGPRV